MMTIIQNTKMSKLPFIDFDADFETLVESNTQVPTNCAAITILVQGNCSVNLNNTVDIPVGGSITISYSGYGIPRLSNNLSLVFNDDNLVNPKVQSLLISRTLIKSVCYE